MCRTLRDQKKTLGPLEIELKALCDTGAGTELRSHAKAVWSLDSEPSLQQRLSLDVICMSFYSLSTGSHSYFIYIIFKLYLLISHPQYFREAITSPPK